MNVSPSEVGGVLSVVTVWGTVSFTGSAFLDSHSEIQSQNDTVNKLQNRILQFILYKMTYFAHSFQVAFSVMKLEKTSSVNLQAM